MFRVMILIILVLLVILVVGTVYAFARPSGSGPVLRFGSTKAFDRQESGDALVYDGAGIFAGIGRLRIPLVNSSTLILSIAFPYPPDDRAFTEELAAKIGDFRAIASDYFSSLAAERLSVLDEDAAKAEILRRYNAILRLGKISTLYFNDLMIID